MDVFFETRCTSIHIIYRFPSVSLLLWSENKHARILTYNKNYNLKFVLNGNDSIRRLHHYYSVSEKKVAPLKLCAIFSLRLSIFP